MPKGDRNLTSIEMRMLILEALATEDENDTPRKHTFKMYGYKGCTSDLMAIVEYLAIKYELIDKVAEIPLTAWGAPGSVPSYGRSTSFNEEESNLFTEELHLLMFQNVLSPGAVGGYGDEWPYFHVTQYGRKCLAQQDVVPYDPDGYMSRIQAISSVDDWERFYIEQSLKCYNAGAIEASIIMLGLAGEYLATRLIDALSAFLTKNEPTLSTNYTTALIGKDKISQRYLEYENSLKNCTALKDGNGNYKYPQLRALNPSLDVAAKAIYATFLRLNRNELAHPSAAKIERMEALTMLVSFIKYCETQHKYLDYYISNS